MLSCQRRSNPHLIAFHPGAHRFPANFLFGDDGDEEAHNALWNFHQRAKTEESDQAHTIRMDVPGVKANRVTIEEKDGEIEITAVRVDDASGDVSKIYQEIFYVNPYKADPSNTKATLTNGVLTITIPKKVMLNETLEVETTTVPTDLSSNVFRFNLDLPGVSASNLTVTLSSDDKVHLQGKRSIGNKRILVERSFEVPPSIDTNHARALLQDGVFTFLAPFHKKPGNSSVLMINVQDEMSVEPSVAQLKLDDDNDNEMNQDKGNAAVETVAGENDHVSDEKNSS